MKVLESFFKRKSCYCSQEIENLESEIEYKQNSIRNIIFSFEYINQKNRAQMDLYKKRISDFESNNTDASYASLKDMYDDLLKKNREYEDEFFNLHEINRELSSVLTKIKDNEKYAGRDKNE